MECVFMKNGNEIIRVNINNVYFATHNDIPNVCDIAEFFGADSFTIIGEREETTFNLNGSRWELNEY